MSKLPAIYVEQLKSNILPYGRIPVPNGTLDHLQANKAYDEQIPEELPRQSVLPHLDRRA